MITTYSPTAEEYDSFAYMEKDPEGRYVHLLDYQKLVSVVKEVISDIESEAKRPVGKYKLEKVLDQKTVFGCARIAEKN